MCPGTCLNMFQRFTSFESHFLQPTWSSGDVPLERFPFEFPIISFIPVLLNLNYLDLLKACKCQMSSWHIGREHEFFVEGSGERSQWGTHSPSRHRDWLWSWETYAFKLLVLEREEEHPKCHDRKPSLPIFCRDNLQCSALCASPSSRFSFSAWQTPFWLPLPWFHLPWSCNLSWLPIFLSL